ncbi:unnamed protein product [Chondrus crispus]|uniref:Uncharacterized protein n=1 Tax=Chondrus crispus TaxID=2769 RepID=R7QCD0_CHOCR|nr:unnamed protein product [Chondrus crispus]CDF35433.1 unnamed protein product [Chondrus crispus]|eukprot:XP_005715252.1 unnamed protein product [Chondrus crispus]
MYKQSANHQWNVSFHAVVSAAQAVVSHCTRKGRPPWTRLNCCTVQYRQKE